MESSSFEQVMESDFLAQAVELVMALMKSYTWVEINLEGYHHVERFPAGTPQSQIIEFCESRVGYGGGGYLTEREHKKPFEHILADSFHTYEYHLSMEQIEKKRIASLIRETEERKLKIAQNQEVLISAELRTAEEKYNRVKRLGDLNEQWQMLHNANRREKRSVSFLLQETADSNTNKMARR